MQKNSAYTTKKGIVMVQLNVSVREDVARQFDELCDGVSKSAVFSQLVRESYTKKILSGYDDFLKSQSAPPPPPVRKHYSILGNN